MKPYWLEEIHERMGRPKWFWPVLFVILLVLWMMAGNAEELA